MDKRKIERSAKAVLEKKLKQKRFRMDLVWQVKDNQLYWNSGHKVGQEMMNSLVQALGSEKEVIAKVRSKSFIQTTKIRKANSTANAVGRYFEYCLYEALFKKISEILGKPDYEERMAANASDSFLEQKEYGVLLANKSIIEEKADLAAEDVIGSFDRSQLDDLLVQAIAGSSTLGDIQIGDIVLELKWYENPSQIKWFTLSDAKHFPQTFREYLKGLNNQQLDTQIDPGEKIIQTQPWVNNIRTVGFQGYVKKVLKTMAGNEDDKQLFSYLLSKAKADKDLNLSKKRIIIGSTGGPRKPIFTFDLQSLIDMSNTISGVPDEDRYTFYQYIDNQNIGNLGYFTVNEREIYDASYEQKKVLHTKSADEVKEWTSTSFLFYLQKGFYIK